MTSTLSAQKPPYSRTIYRQCIHEQQRKEPSRIHLPMPLWLGCRDSRILLEKRYVHPKRPYPAASPVRLQLRQDGRSLKRASNFGKPQFSGCVCLPCLRYPDINLLSQTISYTRMGTSDAFPPTTPPPVLKRFNSAFHWKNNPFNPSRPHHHR